MGGAFQDGPVILGERSTASPALASRGGQLHLGWTGSDYRRDLLGSDTAISDQSLSRT